jgi:hypothetical protein
VALKQIAKVLGLETTKHEATEVRFVITAPLTIESSQEWERIAQSTEFKPQTLIDVTPSKVEKAVQNAQALQPVLSPVAPGTKGGHGGIENPA